MDDTLDSELASFDFDSIETQNTIQDPETSNGKQKLYNFEFTPKIYSVIVNPVKSKTSVHAILVNIKQRGNPIIKAITNVPLEYDEIIPDYQIGTSIGILFLSLRYHNLNPDYIHGRLKILGKQFELRVLLVQVSSKFK